MAASSNELHKTICVVGAGAAGLITAHVLSKDGFTNVELLTRDVSPGGVWAEERVYPGLAINNVHGEFCFSVLPMPPPSDSSGRLGGEDLRAYMESLADRFLKGKIRYGTEIIGIRRRSVSTSFETSSVPDGRGASPWVVHVRDLKTGQLSDLVYDRIVLCSGGCSEPYSPPELTPEKARESGFPGPVVHSLEFRRYIDEVLSAVNPITDPEPGVALVVGGGKSAQDIAAFLANQGRKVVMVFETADAFLASPSQLPDFIRKSRFLAMLSPYVETRTVLEHFLHKTWLGSKITHFMWNKLRESSFEAMKIPEDSPLRNSQPIFWATRTNDEGTGGEDRFHALVHAGKIALAAPARVKRFVPAEGKRAAVVLSDGQTIEADAVLLGTGFKSSWSSIIDDETRKEIGLDRNPPDESELGMEDLRPFEEYISLRDPDRRFHTRSTEACVASNIYRGIVPARNIELRDFAINGAIISTNNGYSYEVMAHWIASYFRKDPFMTRLPKTAAEAIHEAEVHNAWLRKRFPGMFGWLTESYSADMPFFNYAQGADTLLEDMNLPILRSGGNWLTWPFKVVSIQEIAHLTEERAQKREEYLRADGKLQA